MASSQKQQGFRLKINISFAALLVFALCFLVSCGGGSSTPENGGDSVSNFGKLGSECYPNETCDEGLLCDTASNICVEDPDDPTDTGSNKPDEQNNPNDQDTLVEQPDENHQETPNDQDTLVEQPDQDHQETPNDQDTPIEQPDQDVPETPDEQPDQDVPVDPGDVCHGEGCQGNRGCKPGYVWMKNASYYVDTGGDPDYHCVACTDLGESIVDQIRRSNKYCPGGDDLKGAVDYYDQLEKCPKYTFTNDSFDDCVCTYGTTIPKEECFFRLPKQHVRNHLLLIQRLIRHLNKFSINKGNNAGEPPTLRHHNFFTKLSVSISILLKANHFLPKSLSEAPM